jgi:ribose 5-phosphate isomerase B
MNIAFGCDHAALDHRDTIVRYLKSLGHTVMDYGCEGAVSCDYPDKAAAVAEAVAGGKAERGILICGTGIGMSIAANKYNGVRAAVVWNEQTAALASEHNAANVLCLGARFASAEQMVQWIDIWIKTPPSQEERHRRRVQKIAAIEKKQGEGVHEKK